MQWHFVYFLTLVGSGVLLAPVSCIAVLFSRVFRPSRQFTDIFRYIHATTPFLLGDPSPYQGIGGYFV
jgi:hypothetical protein